MAEATPQEQATAKRRILMPVDPSEHSLRAFNWYAEHIHREGDLLVLVHIVEPVCNNLSYGKAAQVSAVADDFSKLLGEHVEKGKSLGNTYFTYCRDKGVKVKFTLHIGNKPGEHICRTAKDQNIDILIMGNRGVGTIRRTFLGSVSDYVIHHTDCPIVIVPPKKMKEAKSDKKLEKKDSKKDKDKDADSVSKASEK